MKHHSIKSIPQLLTVLSLASTTPALVAGTNASTSPAVEATSTSTATGLLVGKLTGETAMDRAWSIFNLYKDDTNPILQSFALQGRAQVQYIDGHSNGHFDMTDYKQDGKDESVWGDHFEARRMYLGFKSQWFNNFKLNGQIDIDPDFSNGHTGGFEFYKDIYELFLSYTPNDAFNASIGKREITFSREQEISSKDILTFERGLLTNLTHAGNLTGVWVNGKGIQKHWLYEAGIFANDQAREFSDFSGGTLFLGKIGYDYADATGLDTATVSFRYIHNSDPGYANTQSDVNYKDPASPAFNDSFCISNEITKGRFGLTSDLIYGLGYSGPADQYGKIKKLNQSDVFGITLIPSYYIAKQVQLVGQVQCAFAADDNGLSLYSRYEKDAPVLPGHTKFKDSGDAYLSAYLGVNYYINSNRLKFINGVEFSKLVGGDYNGYTFMSGIRFSF